MSLHKNPDSFISADALTLDRKLTDPRTRAAVGLHEIAVALSDAGFEVYADTWRLWFHKPKRPGLLGWFARPSINYEIRAHASCFSIQSMRLLRGKIPDQTAGDKTAIMLFIAQRFPRCPALNANTA